MRADDRKARRIAEEIGLIVSAIEVLELAAARNLLSERRIPPPSLASRYRSDQELKRSCACSSRAGADFGLAPTTWPKSSGDALVVSLVDRYSKGRSRDWAFAVRSGERLGSGAI